VLSRDEERHAGGGRADRLASEALSSKLSLSLHGCLAVCCAMQAGSSQRKARMADTYAQ
jgi:hypothetical protein